MKTQPPMPPSLPSGCFVGLGLAAGLIGVLAALFTGDVQWIAAGTVGGVMAVIALWLRFVQYPRTDAHTMKRLAWWGWIARRVTVLWLMLQIVVAIFVSYSPPTWAQILTSVVFMSSLILPFDRDDDEGDGGLPVPSEQVQRTGEQRTRRGRPATVPH